MFQHAKTQTRKRKIAELIAMKVGISVYLDSNLLTEIESNVKGKNRSQKIVKALEIGLRTFCDQPQRVEVSEHTLIPTPK
jgi:metal-responsive CopG/Arc/MetJ family transcriptional regulator